MEGNTFHLSGRAAELRWGYHSAGHLGEWSVTRTADTWALTGTILDLDAFRASQRPLTIVTPNGWQWPVTSLQITDGTLTACIRPKE